jgi:hypothetical protein
MVVARGEVRGGVVAECGNSSGGVASEQCWGCSAAASASTALSSNALLLPRGANRAPQRPAPRSSPRRWLPAAVRAAPAADPPGSAGGSPPRAHHYGRQTFASLPLVDAYLPLGSHGTQNESSVCVFCWRRFRIGKTL